MRQNEMWKPVAEELNKSLFGEQMVCSMGTQLYHIPATQNLAGNNEMHKGLIPASYHRVTANGSAMRLVNGENDPSIIETMIACIKQAEEKDRQIRTSLYVMRNAAPESYKSFIENIIRWQDYTELHLQNAKQLTLQITGSATWQASSYY